MEEHAGMNQRGITVIASLDSMENVVKVDWRNKPVIELMYSTFLQYKSHSLVQFGVNSSSTQQNPLICLFFA